MVAMTVAGYERPRSHTGRSRRTTCSPLTGSCPICAAETGARASSALLKISCSNQVAREASRKRTRSCSPAT